MGELIFVGVYMKLENTHTDQTILKEIGRRLEQIRIARSLTQAELSRRAGIGKRTLERIESGRSAQFSTIVRILRVLESIDIIDTLFAEPGNSPMALLKLKEKPRKRASAMRVAEPSVKPWKWGDE
jgi:transcriptional regulator with XRE-family HTH domain